MAKSQNKTVKTDASVEKFLASLTDVQKKQDSFEILEMMKEITGLQPKMWGSSMIGFGDVHYKYKTGREGDYFLIGFSPRKQAITLYLMYGHERLMDLYEKLGKYKLGKACLYINELDDIDRQILKKLIEKSYEAMRDADHDYSK